jgi:hypothetical protein
VFIMDEGNAMFFGGGVEGGCMRRLAAGFAGDGDVARYRRRSAPSSAVLFGLTVRSFVKRLLAAGGGVRGEDRTLKECIGSASSSSSDGEVKPEE